jgi:threonyl-tRNA synthetase
LYKELENYWRVKHAKLGYKEIMSPLVNKSDLWKISGHWDHYKDDMFIADMGENEVYGIKPMNCPNAMLVFKNTQISYKDLPLRLSDTDRLHRYERSGTLNGLLRCRSFQQDDSHNFITEEMIGSEYEHIMEICKNFYGIFGLEYKFRLGTRPESFIGNKQIWDKAEEDLKEILKKSGKEYTILEGDGAFYGPKIDIIMKDCLGRDWQMGTMQLDFQLPLRFNLEYIDKNGQKKTPVVIHRVIYGSLERFIGILIEHYAGAFPMWLAPEQVWVLPIGEKHFSYAKDLAEKLRAQNIRVVLKDENETIGKKIRAGEMQKIPYLLVVGDKEMEADSVAVRERGKGDLGAMKINKFIERIEEEIKDKK